MKNNNRPTIETATSFDLIRITLTKAHIRKGAKKNCQLCPVALAIRDIFPNAYVYVDKEFCQIQDVYYSYYAPTDNDEYEDKVSEFIDRFDYTKNRERLHGFTFDLHPKQGAYF